VTHKQSLERSRANEGEHADIHPYQIFRPHFLGFSLERHKHHARKLSRQMRNNTNSWTIAGEITGATTDCAYWLNGRGNGARYDATYTGFTTKYGSCEGLEVGSVQKMSAEQKKNVGEFSKAQFTAYDKADGWIFWTCEYRAAFVMETYY